MKNEEINVRNLIDKAVSNLAIILDVKNIKIISNIDEAATINAVLQLAIRGNYKHNKKCCGT